AYFEKTRPEDYHFLDFYEYRLQQSDFTFSFCKESDKLKKDLSILIANGLDKMKEGASIFNGRFKEEASKSIMYDTKKVVDTAIENACSIIANVNTRLTNSKKRVNNVTVPEGIKKIKGSSISDTSSSIDEESEADIKQNVNMNEKDREDGHQPQNGRDLENGLAREASESMVGRIERSQRTPLIMDDIDLEEIFKDYYTYPKHKISEEWEKFIQEFFKQPRDSVEEWKKAWRELHEKIDGNKKDLVDVIRNILGPYIKAFEAPFNILRSGDLRENQYNAQFIGLILENTMNTICSVEWGILEILVESSKARRNTGINAIVDKVLEAKCADGLARLWQSHEEVFLYEQTGSPNFDDITQFHIHDYKLIRTMRDVLNQRIIFHLKNGICDHKDLACFSAFGNRFKVSLFWLTIHQKSYCLREYGTFNIPSTWQELLVLSEAIITCLKFFSFMKENIEVRNSYVGQNQKLLAKRRVHSLAMHNFTLDLVPVLSSYNKYNKKDTLVEPY
ncbi:10356_t:CDS:10, partial [Funneliformis caledonium]